MEFLPILLIFLLFLVPPMLITRSQRKRAQEVEAMRASIVPGDRVISVAGLHGTVTANEGETLLMEIAPGVVVRLETAGVMKKVEGASGNPDGMP